jgi:hypothetical protein
MMEMLGERVAKLRPRCKVLVLSNPFAKNGGVFDEKSQYEKAGIEGLRNGLGRGAEVTVVFPEIRPEYFTHRETIVIPPDSRTPLSFVIRPEAVNQLADAHPECNVIVSLIGLPVGVQQLKIWNEKDPRSFALLLPDLRLLGPVDEVAAAFRREKILAAVFQDPNSGQPLIVTRENIGELLAKNPKAIGY